MRRLLALAVTAAVLSGLAGCESSEDAAPEPVGLKPLLKDRPARKKDDTPATVEQEAVLRVLEANREQFKAQYATLVADSQPTHVTKAFGAYLDGADKIDTKHSPLEFKAAWNRHLKAWKAFHAALGTLPDMYEDVEFMEMMMGLFNGSQEKAKPLGGDVVAAARKLITSQNQLYTAAEGYGVTDR